MQKLCKVKTEEQIKKTLDESGCCSRLGFARGMYRHCDAFYVARLKEDGRWTLYDREKRPLCSDWGYAWTWVSEWLDFDEVVDKNDLTNILVDGCKK